MPHQQKKQMLIYSLYQIGAIQFGDFQLKSGQHTSIYMNLRKIISYPDILREVANAMWESVHECEFDVICGVPYTALPIATCISLEHDIPMVLSRKERKDYGTKQMVEGEYTTGQYCLIIEDVITTGSSVTETARELQNVGLSVYDVVILVDREQGGRESLEKKYKVHTILTLTYILQTLLDSTLLTSDERNIIDQFFLKRSA